MRIEKSRGVFPGGSWSFSTWRPPHLAGVVDHMWAYSGPTSHRRKRVFPNGRVFHQTLGPLQQGGPGRLTDVALDARFL